MKKRLTALLLACIMAFSAAPAAYAAAVEDSAAAEEQKEGWDGDAYYKDGTAVDGLQEIDGAKYYFKNGKVVKNQIVYKIGKKYYAVSKKGVLKQYKDVEEQAAAQLRKLYKKNIPALNAKKTEKLFKKAFLWCANSCVGKKYKGVAKVKNYKKYAVAGFATRKGDCKTQASMLAVMAGILGYKKVKFVHGYVPTAVNSKGKYTAFRTHAWITLKMGKKTYVCDPSFNTSTDAKKLKKKNKYVGYKFRYGAKNTYAYHNAKKKLIKK